MTDKDGMNNNYLLVSTGSGVSPMVSLYSKLVDNPDHKLVNIFGERYHRHVLPSVEKIFSDHNDTTKNILFLSQDEHDGYRQGHVQLALDEALEFLGDKSSIIVFIC
ncbi:hypothetical protein KBC03_00470 [Patescibacteria group bacterium]|nr:hypothetical protein [Patescibacteria group bacterium]